MSEPKPTERGWLNDNDREWVIFMAGQQLPEHLDVAVTFEGGHYVIRTHHDGPFLLPERDAKTRNHWAVGDAIRCQLCGELHKEKPVRKAVRFSCIIREASVCPGCATVGKDPA